MQKKNSFQYMKQNLLSTVLNDCLPKILQILEVTLTKAILRMNKLAEGNSTEIFKPSINTKNNDSNDISNDKKRVKFGAADVEVEAMDVENSDEDSEIIIGIKLHDSDDSEEEEKDASRRILAHTIIDLLNTIDVGLKGTVIRTTEVSCFYSYHYI